MEPIGSPVNYEPALEKFQHARIRSLTICSWGPCFLRDNANHPPASRRTYRGTSGVSVGRSHFFPIALLASLLASLLVPSATVVFAQMQPVNPASPLPDAPLPVIKHAKSKSGPCRVIPGSESAGNALTETGAGFIAAVAGFPPAAPTAPPSPDNTTALAAARELPPCPPPPLINFYERFINGPEVKPLTPKEKARLAVKNVLDPFNAITILANAAIAVGSDSHSDYGPGMHGFAKVVGVSYSEDMTGEFFGTFLIPSIVHQDPHYHRMPHAPIPRRIFHAIAEVGWTQGDNGKGMLNYADIVGFPIDLEIANLYVPGEKTNLPSTAKRYAFGLAIAPTDNFITEFLPDLAKRIHVRIVLVQQIINQVASNQP